MQLDNQGNKHPTLAILEDLIALQSVNPVYGDDACGEKEVAEYIEQRCKRAGLSVSRQQVLPGRDNLIVELRVGKPESTLLFEAHMDTASIGSMVDPLRPTYVGDRLYGRGACDTKGALAGMIYAMEEAAKEPEQLASDLVLCASVDEEHAYRGVLAFLDLNIPVAGAVVGEPTELGIVIAHKGCIRFAVNTHGKAAHSSVPYEGNNAIYQMAHILRFIHEEAEPRLAPMWHPLCGAPSIVVGTIHGGHQVNIVPESCVIEVDRRIVAGEDPEQVLFDLEHELRTYIDDHDINVSVEKLLLDWPLDTSPDAGVVRHAQRVARSLELNATLCGVPYGSDASKLQHRQGIPSIVYGPGSIAQAHARDEWVSVKQVEQAAAFYTEVARTFGQL